jgi:hypothetical protein
MQMLGGKSDGEKSRRQQRGNASRSAPTNNSGDDPSDIPF